MGEYIALRQYFEQEVATFASMSLVGLLMIPGIFHFTPSLIINVLNEKIERPK